MAYSVKISVRELVEFVSRNGDIDTEYTGRNRATIGTQVHTKVQNQRIKEAKLNNNVYEKEFHLKYEFPFKDFNFSLEGRADGVLITDSDVCIEEIKSTYIPIDEIVFDKNHWHLSQAKCYGFMYANLYDVLRIKIILTYHSINEEENISFEEIYLKDQLEEFMKDILDKYYIFAKFDYERINLRNKTLAELEFPFKNYRDNQHDLAKAVYKTIILEKKLFFEAPTGTGKTVSTIFPAVKAIQTGEIEKIFYLTAKTITRQVAEDAFNLMTNQGLRMRVIALTAKDKICLNDKVACNPFDCEYAKGHFDRVNEAMLDLLNNEFVINRDIIEQYSLKHNVCPFEFSLDITGFCDCVICDYNHVYDPKVYLKRYFEEGKRNNFVVLNDETHNLLDRSKDMYSATLTLQDFAKLQVDMEYFRKMYNVISKIIKFIKDVKSNQLSIENVAITPIYSDDFVFMLMNFTKICDKWLVENKENLSHETVLDLFFKVNDFLRIIEYYDERFVFYMEKTKYDVVLKLLCLDSSYVLSQMQKKVKSSIFFSATLSPIKFFKESLGADDEDFTAVLPTSFDINNMKVLIDRNISTKYIDREGSYKPIAQRLATMVNCKTGNYIVYFPSYIYLEKVFEVFGQMHPEIHTIVQGRDLSEEDREEFLQNFVNHPKTSLLAFCVLGGMFSEGIDLIEEMLIGVCIVSVGLPLINPERSIIMDYYNGNGLNGFDYAYKFPGMNKVLQAGGRVVRTEKDKGIVYLIDQRFTYSSYNYLFPAHWQNYSIVNDNNSLESCINKFWDSFD